MGGQHPVKRFYQKMIKAFTTCKNRMALKKHIAEEGEEKESGGREEVWRKTSQARGFVNE